MAILTQTKARPGWWAILKNFWAKIDRELVEETVAVPYQWAKEPYIESKDVAGVNEYWNSGTWDYAFTSLK